MKIIKELREFLSKFDEYNSYHDTSGQWASKQISRGSRSKSVDDPEKERVVGSGKSKKISPKEMQCGRIGKYRCKDGTPKW